ncbi:hypothetical protein HDU93_008784 [Gonapodya sp. JEL0774]|nr:hypothetical protein HDU93_008784 [Gonapodya sp. JEL0774]
MSRPVFDVSGANGLPGKNGAPGREYSSGAPGENATSGTRGQDAGNITLQISSSVSLPDGALIPSILANPDETSIRVQGTATGTRKVGSRDWVQFKAKGGDGGIGGNGGRGGTGATGSRGQDATRYSSGTNGGPGGPGGRGGDAGAGGDGGNGGAIFITIREEDSHLLALFDPAPIYARGVGGRQGNPGPGGSGGRGGSGGSSYTYTETHHVPPSADGKNPGSTYTTTHTNPGGWSGPNGPDGPNGSTAPSGRDGKEGSFRIRIDRGARGIDTYSDIYRLKITRVSFRPENGDSNGTWAEPNTRLLVTSTTVSNPANMPTPSAQYPIMLYMRDSGSSRVAGEEWILAESLQNFIVLPGAIKGSIQVPCKVSAGPNKDQYLGFRTANIDPVRQMAKQTTRRARGDPMVLENAAAFRIFAQAAPFGRDLQNFCQPWKFTLRYPIELSNVQHLGSILPGEDCVLLFNLKNIALRPYGRLSDSKRRVLVRVEFTSGDIPLEHITYWDDHNPRLFKFNPADSVNGHSVIEYDLIGKDTTLHSTAHIQLSPEVKAYSSATFNFSLCIGSPDGSSGLIVVQRREVTIRASSGYTRTPGARTLLVTNSQTTTAELDAWNRVARYLHGDGPQGAVDIWDLSHEGKLDFKLIGQDWADCTVVVLDNPFDNQATHSLGEDDFARNYIHPDDVLSAVTKHQANFLFLSPSQTSSTHYTASMAPIYSTIKSCLEPFAYPAHAFAVYNTSAQFEFHEALKDLDGARFKRLVNVVNIFAKKTHPTPVLHFSNEFVPTDKTHGDLLVIEHRLVEMVVCVVRKKPFNSLRKPTAQATALQSLLEKYHPQRRYAFAVCHKTDFSVLTTPPIVYPENTQAIIRFRRLVDHATSTPRLTICATPPSPVTTTASSSSTITIHSPSYITSEAVSRAYIRATPFPLRVSLYKDALRAVAADPAALSQKVDHLRDSLAADLIEEQLGIGSCGALSAEGIVLRMPRLMSLVELTKDTDPITPPATGTNGLNVAQSHWESLFVTLLSMVQSWRGKWQVMANTKEREVVKAIGVAVARGPAPSSLDAVRKGVADQLKSWKGEIKTSTFWSEGRALLRRAGTTGGQSFHLGILLGEFDLLHGGMSGPAVINGHVDASALTTRSEFGRVKESDVARREAANRSAVVALTARAV